MSNRIKELFEKYSLATYKRAGPVFVRGKGSYLWDTEKNCYLDMFPGWGVSILGHCHPKIVQAINEQAQKLIHLPNNLYQEEQILLAKEIVKNSFSAKVFFANSGSEGIECAIKFSRLYGRKSNRYEIITMKNSFHGRTFGALSATGQKKYQQPFKPILPKFREADFNDFNSFKEKITSKTVGVILELIQGEGGINIADIEYVKQLKKACDDNNLLFIVDEVQTAMGRTGKLFCYENYEVIPDVMILSKGLGAGLPISAVVIRKDIADIIQPGMHASTFGGSPLVSRVSREVFNIIKEEKILQNVQKIGGYLAEQLKEFKNKFSFITEVRNIGLMLGIELSCESFPLFQYALEKKLIINSTHGKVLRIMPALNVTREDIDKGLEILEDVFRKFQIKTKDRRPKTEDQRLKEQIFS